MDLYAKLSSSMEELTATFTSRMQHYEEELKSAGGNEVTHKTLASLSREFSEFKSLIWKTVSSLKTQMELLIVGLDRHEMASRKQVLLLHGLPEEKDENHVAQAVHTIVEKLKIVSVSPNDIVTCHRLGSTTGKPRPLLIRFQGPNLRNEVWRNKTSLKGTGLILSEFLTKPRHDTFINARKHFGVKQCWTSDGKIVVLLPNKTRRKIESATELQELLVLFPTVVLENSNVSVDSSKGTSVQTSKSVQDKRLRKPAK